MAEPKRNHGNPPGDFRSAGEATFNYCAHDGHFLIGTEPWQFETSWTGAGMHQAHLYNDPSSIRGIAIAEGVSKIGQVNAEVIANSDFTSRTRTPRVGQFAVLENQNGFFAVLEILSVEYSDLPSKNLMILRFVIQTNGSADFGSLDPNLDADDNEVRALLKAAEESKIALAAVQGTSNDAPDFPFGHNGPPPEYALSEAERHQVIAAVDIVAEEATRPSPDIDRLKIAAKTIVGAVQAIGRWIADKADLALDEFAKTIGKAAAVVTVSVLAAYVALQGKLVVLAHLLSSFTG